MPNEPVDLVDEKNRVIGEIMKDTAHKTGARHRAVHVWVFNSKGELFLQFRSRKKLLFPAVWDSSASEHVKKGESFEEAAKRGLEEELGIKEVGVSFVAQKEVDFKDEKVHNDEILQLFECIYDGKIRIEKSEIDEGRFFSMEEVKRIAESKKTSTFRALLGIYLQKKRCKKVKEAFPKTSIIIATYNNAAVLKKASNAMLRLDYPENCFEIIVASDGSTDETAKMMRAEFGKEKRIRFLDLPKHGVCKARNAAIAAASKESEIIVNMDHDCIPEKDWLKKIVAGFDSERVGVVSSYNYYGGTSTAFRRDLLEKVGGYDEQYGYYREDTDLSFKIMDLGFEFKRVQAGFEHDHKLEKPKGTIALARHVLQRLRYHENDVLLYKKHPTQTCREFLNIRLGFLVSPMSDFRAATGTWHKGGRLKASSPRGIVFLENKTQLHAVLIIILGILYVIGVKFFRLVGSIKFWKFLI